MPYIFVVVFVLLWGYKPIQDILNFGSFAVHWPALHNLILRKFTKALCQGLGFGFLFAR